MSRDIELKKTNYGLSTRAIHSGQDPEQWNSMCVIPPIILSTTFKQPYPAEPKLYDYGRSGNPTRNVLETCLAGIEEANYCLVFASGLGAITTISGLLNVNDNIICCDDVYGGTGRLFRHVFEKLGISITFVDATDVRNIKNKFNDKTKLVWIETPTNPLLKVINIKEVSKICKQHGIILVVDNTFLTPCFQKPLKLGADLVVYSLTKYMNGHCDVIMGSIVMNDESLHEKLKFLQNSMGIVPSPFDCQMVNRGLKTLQIRMNRHMDSALKIAKYLEGHDKIKKVIHPLLKSHDQHELVLKQTSGHSGILSVYLKCDYEKTKLFIKNLKLFTLAESLGGFESLIEIPSLMTHASVPDDVRERLNITDSLLRISVGLEDSDDLIDDLNQALKYHNDDDDDEIFSYGDVEVINSTIQELLENQSTNKVPINLITLLPVKANSGISEIKKYSKTHVSKKNNNSTGRNFGNGLLLFHLYTTTIYGISEK